MKRIIVPILILLTLTLAGAAWYQAQTAKSKSVEVARLQTDLQNANAKSEETSEKISALENKAEVLSAESAALREKLHASSAAAATPTPDATPAATDEKKDGMGAMLGKMLGDPKMRKAIAAQQSMVLRQFYSDFVKQANLTPEQADKFFAALGERQAAMMEKAGDMMKGGQPNDEAKRAMEDQTKAFDAQLKEILGDNGAKQFHDFEKSLPDRIAMNQLSQQLSGAGTALSSDQNRALMQVMADERQKKPMSIQPGNAQAMSMSDEQIQQYFAQQEDLNSRVRTRAMSLLTADQMKAFEQFQKQQLDMQKMGMTMAREMFGGKK